jgi:hypothetical protein
VKAEGNDRLPLEQLATAALPQFRRLTGFAENSRFQLHFQSGKNRYMMAKLKFMAPLLMAGAAAAGIAASPFAVADAYATAAGASITHVAPLSPGGDGCANGVCGSGGPGGGGGCTADGVCGHGGPGGGGGCIPGVGCFEWGQ